MDIKIVQTSKIKPYPKNPRVNTEAVGPVVASIREFGFRQPIVVDEDCVVIAGHTRLEAAKVLELKMVPVHVATGLSPEQVMAYRIADNKTAEYSEWDLEALRIELNDLKAHEYDVSLTGYTIRDLALLGDVPTDHGKTDPDDVPEVPEEPTAKLGQIWQLGDHRLMCGDSTSEEDVGKLMDGQKADMVFTDPPYGISIVSNSKIGGDKAFGSVGGKNIVKANTYAKVEGDDSIDVAVKAIDLINNLNIPVQMIWGGNYYANYLENSSCWIVWDKQNTGNFADCELAWTNQKTAVRQFKHTWNGMIKASEHGQKRVHPTQKPVALAEWCFEQYGEKRDRVLDLFGGSGSTLIGCEKSERSCYMMEISKEYCDVIIKRWEDYTEKKAVLCE